MDFVNRVAYIEDRDGKCLRQSSDKREDFGFAFIVKRSKRLVHEQKMRAGKKGTTDCHTLLLSTGKLCRTPVKKMADSEESHYLIELHIAFRRRHELQSYARLDLTDKCGNKRPS